MRKTLMRLCWITCAVLAAGVTVSAAEPAEKNVIPPITQRYQDADVSEVPNFQKHVVPLFGRLGCNGRACHGSFQGRGGFRLSLFGYDFKADHDALFDKESPRVDVDKPLESLIISKPTDADMHEGGKRYDKDSWQYHVIRRWIEGGAKFESADVEKLNQLVITPSEIEFSREGQEVQLQAIAVWADGSREDVTPLCRFQSNDDQVATITDTGLVTATNKGDTHVVVFYDKAVIPIQVIRPVTDLVGAKYPGAETPTKIDELVVNKLKKLGIVQSEMCTDAEFIRRVYLDMTGTLPTAEEVRSFLADKSPDKRGKKVDQLLETPAYAAWWTTKLCDFTGNNDAQLNNVGAVRGRVSQDWWDWINKRVAANTPYDQLAAGIILGKSRNDGESYLDYCEEMTQITRGEDGHHFADRQYMPYYWARTNVRQPEERAIAFAYSFMGVRIECAQCHKHPFDQWSKADFDEFKKFFATISNNANAAQPDARSEFEKLSKEIGIGDRRLNNNERQKLVQTALKDGKVVPFGEVYVNRPRAAAARGNTKGRRPTPVAATTARILGGEELDLSKFEDTREPLMDWLRNENQHYFARSFANRVWASYFNVGIVNPTDDLNLANPPSNRELLDYLTEGFIRSGYDMKWLHREIANSRTYQLSWITNSTNEQDERNFSRSVPRRLPAEVAVDAVNTATSSDAKAAKMLTEVRGRSIAIAGSSSRNNRGGSQFALSVFGRSTRESNCDCDRSMDASLLQTVYLQNDNDVRSQLEARDSWVSQVLLELAKDKQSVQEKSGEGSTDLAAEIKSIERRLERLRKQKNGEQVNRAETQLAQLRKELAVRNKKAASEKEASSKVDSETAGSLVETAYLRTLSRLPTADELQVATSYVVEDGDLANGLRDVMWALINTKEFIVNH